ncbi:hypothetical protein AKJ59_00110 [candidate division MSBL1 archaeon SCGC-AAA385M02]|uniref:Uncharacterized protein n=1 Tax=candidate division MSBL1 archaeon SCGC-AAA385M02 TaxID=1698287 RepID=A0A133VR82_9EURY|nr:hypothetical protein AKJ59_00110 [candidate division MSBL1 archaeon SCGC-AAA385M02]
MSNRKTIKINPDLFKTSGKRKTSSTTKKRSHTKTQRKREKKKKPKVNIKPSILRRALFERIKEKKKKERLKEYEASNANSIIEDSTSLFDETFNHLLEFEKQKKLEKEARRLEKNEIKKRKREILSQREKIQGNQSSAFNKTLKHYGNNNNNSIQPIPNIHVETELPEALKVHDLHIEPTIQPTPPHTHTDPHTPINNTIHHLSPIQLKPRPPYGCLKNGKTPTYRQWRRQQGQPISTMHNKTLKHYGNPLNNKDATSSQSLNLSNDMRESLNKGHEKSDREKILDRIRREIQQKKQEIEKKDKFEKFQKKYNELMKQGGVDGGDLLDKETSSQLISNGKIKKKFKKHIKTIRKKTIKRKYKLGKQLSKNKVSVLIKNKKTRKKIQHEEKLLKRIHIMEIKNQLVKMGLLKHGSTAPNDVIRKMYENAILSGEINNVNKDVLIHNYMESS